MNGNDPYFFPILTKLESRPSPPLTSRSASRPLDGALRALGEPRGDSDQARRDARPHHGGHRRRDAGGLEGRRESQEAAVAARGVQLLSESVQETRADHVHRRSSESAQSGQDPLDYQLQGRVLHHLPKAALANTCKVEEDQAANHARPLPNSIHLCFDTTYRQGSGSPIFAK